MKRMVAFISILLFAVLFIISYAPRIYDGPHGKTINNAAQGGLSVSILLFFMLDRRKKNAAKRNKQHSN
jgi:hypothetical protein